MTASYDPLLILLSVIIAVLASLTALSFANQITSGDSSTRWGWLVGGAVVMGLGIWSMHFVGMLAFQLPVAVHYSASLVLLSVGVAVAASLLALVVASRPTLKIATLMTAGLCMGAAIAGMHYIGMAAMHTAAALSYSFALVVLSILIAVAASIAALWLAYRFRSDVKYAALYKAIASVVMGFAIAGMHYTAMAAARFKPAAMHALAGESFLATDQLGRAVAAGALAMIALALTGLLLDRRILRRRVALTDRLEAQASALEKQTNDLVVQAAQLEAQSVELEMLNEQLLGSNRALETALAEAERATGMEREANLMRTRFVNMASHELRTPLGAIGGYVELLLLGIHGALSPAQQTAMQRVQINQRHILRLINEMLELARLEARQMPLQLSELELLDLLESTRPMLDPQLNSKQISYSRDFGANIPRIVGDAEKVQQILINLLANSIKFTPISGKICVSARSSNHTVEVRVTDSGPGISPELADSLFTPFRQLTGKSAGQGTGLGLAISRELARAMGGDLDVERSSESGATFVLSLVAVDASPQVVYLA